MQQRAKSLGRNLFYSNVIKTDTCWLWTGRLFQGYGIITRKKLFGKETVAHRISWILSRGSIPSDLCVLHNCPGGDNRACVNPEHLWLGTRGDNNRDREAKGRGGRAFGLRNGRYTHPETTARGSRNGQHTHPESTARGERVNTAKLTKLKVKRIRALFATGRFTQIALATRFGVSGNQINLIVRNLSWRHV